MLKLLRLISNHTGYQMKSIFFYTIFLNLQLIISAQAPTVPQWITGKRIGYQLFYCESDIKYRTDYIVFIDEGIKTVQSFFSTPFKNEFSVYIHPDRKSMDIQWGKDWNQPGFKSECWMVASGVASRIDILSPEKWVREACEHDFADKLKTQQLITHELVHVFHGQLNTSPDFSDVTGIDWFVEGLAVYASGQCDKQRIYEIKSAVRRNAIPNSLDNFWSGNLKYGLSGSLVMYIDGRFGRHKLTELLKFNRKSDILNTLNISEQDLLKGWLSFIDTLN
jgi:hypothetical protein